jgi:GTP cyclohydrolase II
MKIINGHAAGLFGQAGIISVERGLAEFRAGRPVILATAEERVVALPVDGLSAARLATFQTLCAPAPARLAISARRARALGLDGSAPLLLRLPDGGDLARIRTLVAEDGAGGVTETFPAGPAAAAAVELAKLALRLPALIVADDVAPGVSRHEPPLVTVMADAVAEFRQAVTQSIAIAGEAKVPLQGGVSTRFVVFRDAIGGGSTAVVVGEPDFSQPVPVRLHSSCLTGDVFGSSRCDCGDQLKLAIARLQEAGGGVILYLDQEGRGVGLVNKMRAYALQDEGLDTVDANTTLGFDDDERDYGTAVRMLRMLGCTRVLLLTNNPAKLDSLADAGIEVAGRMPLYTAINVHNRRYLTAKAMRAGHQLDHLMAALADAGGSQAP